MELKRILVQVALCISTLAALGQNTVWPSWKSQEVGPQFNPHGYIQIQVGVAQTIGETVIKDLLSPAAALSVGYQFTSLWGIRAGLSGWQARGAWATLSDTYKYNYLQGNVDVTLDVSRLFCHYNPKRFFNAYAFLGVGASGTFNNDDAVILNEAGYQMEYLWRNKNVFVAGRGGLGANLRLSDYVFFNIEVNANVLSDKFNSKKADNPDWQFNALAGFTIKFGKNKKKNSTNYELAPLPVHITKEVKQEQESVYVAIEEKKVDQKEEIKPWSENIFFKIGSAAIRSSEENKLLNLVSFLKKNLDIRISICGYADAATGTNEINLKLSKKRAQAVEKALKAKGIAADRITIDFKGDKIQPFSKIEENRVAICITE